MHKYLKKDKSNRKKSFLMYTIIKLNYSSLLSNVKLNFDLFLYNIIFKD